MRLRSVLASATVVLSLATLANAEGTWREKIKERVAEKLKETQGQIATLRQAVADFFAAKDAANREAALAAVAKARQAWQALPESFRSKIEEKRPGTSERLKALHEEYDLPDEPATLNASGAVTGPAGKTVTREDTWTREGNTITRDGSVTGPGGKTATIEGTTTREGNTVTRDTTVTGPGGKTVEQDVTWKKDGNTVTRDGQTTTSGGKSVTSQDTFARNGNTVTREGTSTGSGGRSVARDDTWTRSGNTVTHDGARTYSGGTKQWKPSYADDHDIFGGRPKPPTAKRSTGGKRGR
ncbi:MAG: hypothetical protein FJ291_22070 [Planctomycetes bacterium]|nr:hypothetical protein [Planctomycetota bacterium]